MAEHGGEERELLKPLKVMVKIIEELYPSENGGYQHSEEYRAVHAALRDAREAIKRAGVASPPGCHGCRREFLKPSDTYFSA